MGRSTDEAAEADLEDSRRRIADDGLIGFEGEDGGA